MAGKHKFGKVIRIVIFMLIVGITGYALSSTGNVRNPFTVFSALTQASAQGPQVAGGTDRRPPDGAANGGERIGGPQGGSIAWSQIGGVLFNVWFLFAVAGLVIIFQTVMGYVKESLRPRKRRVALAA